ncbi:MAG: hypothetical protein Q8M06_00405 [Methanobacteriaceae archaeon]|nr:hypothetical protein [Methanobacteriaceae archaeon]MDZ4172563.1 hypothetical protein [Methanobacteriaceae archaeon]
MNKLKMDLKTDSLKLLEIAAVLMGLSGAFVLSAFKSPLAFLLWTFSNPIFLYFTIKRKEYWMSTVWVMYLATSMIGIIMWK